MNLSLLRPAEAVFVNFATSKSFQDVLDYDLKESSCTQIQNTPDGDYRLVKCSNPGGTDYFVCHPKDSLRVIDDQLNMFGYAIVKKITSNDVTMYEVYPAGLGSYAYPSAPALASPMYARDGMSGYGNYLSQPLPVSPTGLPPALSSLNSFTPSYNLPPGYSFTPSYSLTPSYNIPSYNIPSYNISSYNIPSYNTSGYNVTPGYNLPSYNTSSYNVTPNYNLPSYNPYSGNYWGQQALSALMGTWPIGPPSLTGAGPMVPTSLLLNNTAGYNQPALSPYSNMPNPLLSADYRYPLSPGGFPFNPFMLPTVLQPASSQVQALNQAISNSSGVRQNFPDTLPEVTNGNLSNLTQPRQLINALAINAMTTGLSPFW